MKNALVINNLYAQTIDGKEILRGVSLTIKIKEKHVLMGPNGGGKSTLAQVLMGHPGYVITKGTIFLDGVDITRISVDKKAKLGLFLGFQYPVEVPGVNFASFLRMAFQEKKSVSLKIFKQNMQKNAKQLGLREDMTERSLNEGFSGGEKKKAEILQMSILKPRYVVLDEPDSGLDVDALQYIAHQVESLNYSFGLLLITHYQRILKYLKPDFVHVLVKGKIVQTGNASLASLIEEKGYNFLFQK